MQIDIRKLLRAARPVALMPRLLLLLALLPAAVACNSVGEPRRSIVLLVESVAAPSEVAAGSELVATITVITGGCKSFDRFVTTRNGSRLTVEAHGSDAGRGLSCPADVRYEPREYRAALPASNPFQLAVRQPNGSEIVREITIR